LRKITIQNIHPRLRVKKTPLKLLIKNLLSSEKTNSGVDVILVDDNLMKELNREFTKRGKTTDVLSFGMREGKSDPVEYPGLGDVYVCLDQAKRQADERQLELEEEVALLVAHGVLHLLGYDHQKKNQEAAMRKKERGYLKKMKASIALSSK
jgi:probable rRNA maturation factor